MNLIYKRETAKYYYKKKRKKNNNKIIEYIKSTRKEY